MTESLREIDQRSFLHPWSSITELKSHGALVMHEGKGVRLWDVDGREYIDALAGLWCVDVGYGRDEIADAISTQAHRLPFYHSFFSMATEPAILLADRLLELTPWPMKRVFFGLSGSDANDTQIKLVWLYNNLRGKPEKRKIIARHRGYHGITIAATSATGLPIAHAHMGLPLSHFVHVTTPHSYRESVSTETENEFTQRLAEELDETICREGPDTVAAFIAEPVMGAGGVLTPPPNYFKSIQEVLRKHDVMFIDDEVICGFGRLGQSFGSEVYDIEPDLVTVAKGLSSGYAPISACLISEKVWSEISAHADELGQFAHGFTYSGHPLGAVAAMANLDIMERESLFERAASLGQYMQERMRAEFKGHPLVGEVRGIGLIGAIEIVADQKSHKSFDPKIKFGPRVFRDLLQRGVVARAIGDSIALCPAYVIEREEIDYVLTAVRESIEAVATQVVD